MARRRTGAETSGVAFGLIAGVVAGAMTGQWWLIGVGLALGTGAAAVLGGNRR